MTTVQPRPSILALLFTLALLPQAAPTPLPGVPLTGNRGTFDPILVLVILLAALSALSGLIISFRARSSRTR